MPEPESLFNIIMSYPLQAGTVGGALVLLCSGFGKLFADLTINSRNAEFDRQLEKTKAFLDQEREHTKSQLVGDLSKIRAELSRDADTHRSRLKKSDLLFEKEVDAARDFLELQQRIEPRWSHPDEGYEEAVRDLTDRLGGVEQDLRKFLAKFGYVMTPAARDALKSVYGRPRATSSTPWMSTSTII